jgi:cytochrome c oxidase subunit 2
VRDRRVLWMLGLGFVASVLGIAAGLAIDWFPTNASSQADKIDTLYDVLIIASVPMFVIVTTVVIGSVVFFRMRPGQELEDGPPIHGNTRLEVIWTVLPALIIAGLCTYAFVVLEDIEKKPSAASAATREFKLGVTGEQFAWTFTYPKELTGGKPLNTAQLYLPKGRSVDFRIHAKDVLHDFWVPAFRMKLDAVPGIETHYRVTPTKLGNFQVVCAELCGLGHATMRAAVHVVTPAAFSAWLKKQTAPVAPAGAGAGQVAEAGKKVFADNGCAGCHTLADAGANGTVGPNLDKVLKGKDAAFIRTSIVDPNAEIAPGFGRGIMPGNFGKTLSKDELDALVAYLKEVTS